MFRSLITMLALTGFAQAEVLLTPDEFQGISEGKTLYFNNINGFHGAEQYFENRQVRWKFAEGQCQEGYWYGDGEAICFQYDNEPAPICWLFWQTDTGIFAVLDEAFDSAPLKLEFVDTREILCEEPYLGVKADVPGVQWTPIPARP